MKDYTLYKNRRKQVVDFLRRENPSLKNGMIVLFADFENSRNVFRQESSFYYLTGIAEPGAILCFCLDGSETLYLPNYGGLRDRWVKTSVADKSIESLASFFSVSQVKYLGKSCGSYTFSPVFKEDHYESFILDLHKFFKANFDAQFFSLFDNLSSNYHFQIQTYRNCLEYLPFLQDVTRDIAPLIHHMRRFKDELEVDLIYKAVQITSISYEAVADIVVPGRFEYEIQAGVESVFTQLGSSRPAFPSIIAAGENSTILHYAKRDKELESNDLVVVDVGAEYQYYASDLTRTFPVDGKFSKEQLEVYDLVLETQNYVESIAKPGTFLNNFEKQDLSLNHLATKFLQDKGYGKYVAHSIGHFLGLDVHDVGSMDYPLAPGDVFTIEPGLYIPEQDLGVRIEDDYLMTEDGVVCLSCQLPKKAKEIETLMAKK